MSEIKTATGAAAGNRDSLATGSAVRREMHLPVATCDACHMLLICNCAENLHMPPTRGFQSFGVLIMKLNVPLKANTLPRSPFAIPPPPLYWHSWTRAANAACETINHEIENAADDDDSGDDLKSKSMQSRLLSQFRQAAESGLPPSTPTSRTLFPIPILTHVLRPFVPLLWPGRRKEVPERARALPQSKCLPRIRAPKVQQEERKGDGGDTLNIALFGREFKRYALAPDTKTP